MIRIALIRPGATEFDAQQRIQGTLDIPLSPEGQQQVAQAVEALRGENLTALYSSPCESAWQSASKIGEALGVKVKQIDNLENLDLGLWQGTLVEEVKRKQPTVYRQWQEHPETVCPPQGESVIEAQERIHWAVAKLLKKHKSGTIGLVCPEPLASLIRCYLAQSDLGDLWKRGAPCGGWEWISVEPASLVQT